MLCPQCRNKTRRQVGWLKEHLTFGCDHCPAVLRYERDLLQLDIETAGAVATDIPGAVTLVEPGRKDGGN